VNDKVLMAVLATPLLGLAFWAMQAAVRLPNPTRAERWILRGVQVLVAVGAIAVWIEALL
jgi:hypothetical protein